MRRPLAAAAVVLTAAALALLPAAPGQAHAALVSASPAAGAVVDAAPRAVTLEFDEDLLDLGRNAVGVTDAAGRQYATGCATVTGTRLAVPVALGASGTYRVTWRASSADGHLVGDSYSFRYRAPAGAVPAASASPPPSCAPIAGAAAPAIAGPSTGTLVAIVVAGVVLLLIVVAAVVVVVLVRRADRGAAEAGDRTG